MIRKLRQQSNRSQKMERKITKSEEFTSMAMDGLIPFHIIQSKRRRHWRLSRKFRTQFQNIRPFMFLKSRKCTCHITWKVINLRIFFPMYITDKIIFFSRTVPKPYPVYKHVSLLEKVHLDFSMLMNSSISLRSHMKSKRSSKFLCTSTSLIQSKKWDTKKWKLCIFSLIEKCFDYSINRSFTCRSMLRWKNQFHMKWKVINWHRYFREKCHWQIHLFRSVSKPYPVVKEVKYPVVKEIPKPYPVEKVSWILFEANFHFIFIWVVFIFIWV